LLAAGLGFVTYLESLPSVGFTGCSSGNYVRKHNPAVNFPAVPTSSNLPLTAFPTDFSTLPAVSFVVPNLQNDMHDGTIATGDTWVQQNMKPYVSWAMQHNSILVVTWDEDDYTSANRIPTIFVGAGITPGRYSETINHYNVLRTIEDAYGLAPVGASATAKPVLDIWAPAAGTPQASFTVSCAALTCSADGTASTGGAGPVAGYSWAWGDDSPTGTGATSSHAYAAAGDYQVTLTVSNDSGTSGTTSHPVSPRPLGAVAPLASDAFDRTVANGLGTADVGGAWTVSGAGGSYAVAGGVASLTAMTAGSTLVASLTSVSSSDTDVRVSIGTDKLATGTGSHVAIIGRQVSSTTSYQGHVRIRADGVPVLSIVAQEAGSAVALKPAITIPGLSLAAGGVLKTEFVVTGTNPTSLALKVWPAASAEPTSSQLTATDSFAALQAPGWLGISTHLSAGSTIAPVVLRISDLSARKTVAAHDIAPPVARMTLSCADLGCTVDGTASGDTEGPIVRYQWSWGDGTAITIGATSSHRYPAGGSFPVTLTVTDDKGSTATFLQTADPTAPVNQSPVALVAVSCTNLLCTADSAGSADPDGQIVSYAWNWGDGSHESTGQSATHAYAFAGTYLVTLTVTDNGGSTDSGAASVTPTLAPNELPTASLGVTCTHLVCEADSTGSVDPDGTIDSYAWDWGDGSSATDGATSTHTYASAGSFTITLTVSDNRSGTGTATQPVNP
jgi:PKD repeat protein